MKNIYKFYIHPLSYLVALISFLTGHFKNYIVFMIIILIHEAGHVLAACFFKWKIEKIIILPFGGLTKFNEKINKPIYEEFIISIMGIIFQFVFCYKLNTYYNIIITIFNLLPIYPLDGSKILNLLLNKITNFKKSYLSTLYVSYTLIALFLFIIIIYKDLIMILIFIPLLMQLNIEYKKRKNVISKFYLERHLYEFDFKRIKTIKKLDEMKRDYKHYFIIKDEIMSEKDFLNNYYR